VRRAQLALTPRCSRRDRDQQPRLSGSLPRPRRCDYLGGGNKAGTTCSRIRRKKSAVL